MPKNGRYRIVGTTNVASVSVQLKLIILKAIFCYNRAGDDKGAKRAGAFDSRREGRSRRFTDIESSTTFFEKAIELFIEINMLEDAADCYEQIGRYDKAAEYWKGEGQLQRAARLYEMGMNFRAASECYDADGDFEKAVEILRQGGEFDELIHYLDRNPEKLESKFKHRYSRLCNILLKQGRISSDLRATTINLLGSEEEKLEFFQEFEMTEDLSSYYASNEKWLQLYELSLANGEVLAAVSIVLEHGLIEKVDPECFEQALNYSLTESIYLNSNWSRADLEGGKEHAAFLLLSKFEEAFRETWLKSHLSQWRVTLSVLGIIRLGDEDIAKLAPTGSSLMGNFTCLALAGLGAQAYLQECENVRQLLLIPILKYANIIQELEDGPSREATSLASLHLICGIYNRDTYGKPSMIFNWSPIASDGNKDEETSADELTKFTSDAIEWAKGMLAKAIVMFNERARDLMFREFPKRCGAFLIRGSCMKQNAGQCNYFHEQPNAKVCQVCLFSIAHIADFYCRLNRLYYRRIMPVSFQESFPGRRRYWLQQLEEEISFVSSFEQSSEALMELRSLFQQDSRYDFTISCWKDLLLYRLTDNWHDIQPFTAILRQMEFAHFLGTTTERFFRQVLWRHVESIMHRQRAPSLFLKVAQDAIRLRQRVLFLASKARDRYGCTNLV